MSDKPINDGGPAFPTDYVSQNQSTGETTVHQPCGGLTVRQYYAGQALPAVLSAHYRNIEAGGFGFDVEERCFRVADSMLREGSKS